MRWECMDAWEPPAPDSKTVANLPRASTDAIRLVCREFVMLCLKLGRARPRRCARCRLASRYDAGQIRLTFTVSPAPTVTVSAT